jgi:hypothetical protein
MYRKPSGPISMSPPLWLGNGWSTASSSRAEAGSTVSPFMV